MNKLPDHFSFSALSTYENCPMAYKLLYLDGGKLEDEGNAYSDFGTFCHKLLDAYNKGDIPDVALAEEYIAGFRDAIAHPFPPFPYGLSDKYYKAGLKYFAAFTGYGEEWDILASEEKFTLNIDGYKIVGVVDLILINRETGEIWVVDHKSKSKSSMTKEFDLYRKQLYLYAMYIHQKYGTYPAKLSFNMFKEGYWIDESFDPAMVDKTKAWALDLIHRMENDATWHMGGSSYFCEWICPVLDVCPGKEAILMTR